MLNLFKAFLFSICFLIVVTVFGANEYSGVPVKNIILFIGDGMSVPQRLAAQSFSDKKLLIDKFPVQGITTTKSYNRFVTDSAAAGTALATGMKTNNGCIGLDSQGRKLKSIAFTAKELGRKVGIITTVSIDHATPAAFYAHNISRGNYYKIARNLPESGFDFFGGGGFKMKGARRDNLKAYAKINGYEYIDTKDEILFLKIRR